MAHRDMLTPEQSIGWNALTKYVYGAVVCFQYVGTLDIILGRQAHA